MTQQDLEVQQDEEQIIEGAAEEVETPEGGDQESQADGRKPKPWFQQRIDEVTAEKWSARREADAAKARAADLERQLAAVQSGPKEDQPAVGEDGKPMTAAEINALAEKKAEEKLRVDRFNESCNTVFEKGKTAFDDFETVLSGYKDLGGLSTEFIEAALETEVPHLVLYELGKNQDEAYRVLKLSPVKMAVEMTKLAAKLSQPKAKPVSNAPPPIGTRRGQAKPPETDPDKMGTKEWMEWRTKQLAAKK